jgi:hypothetical protein
MLISIIHQRTSVCANDDLTHSQVKGRKSEDAEERGERVKKFHRYAFRRELLLTLHAGWHNPELPES